MINDYEVRGNTTAIFLRSRHARMECLIDTADLTLVKAVPFRLTLAKRRTKSARLFDASFFMETPSSKRSIVHLSRLLTGEPVGLVVDHVNHCPLDNRRSNLRIVTNEENVLHRRPEGDWVSSWGRIVWRKNRQRWIVQKCIAGKRRYFGSFASYEDAAKVAATILRSSIPA